MPSRRRHILGALGSPVAFATATATAAAIAASGTNGCDAPPPPSDVASADASIDVVADAPWDHVRAPYDATTPAPVSRVPVHAETVSQRVDTAALLFAAAEMQISGEPFASHFAGRTLDDYDRTYLPPDQYILGKGGDDPTPVTDLFGFSTAVESYEYSKYHMNMVAQQTSAGVSLAYGPIVAARTEATPLARLQAVSAALLTAVGADVAGYATLPPPASNPQNVLGFNGLWPNFAPYRSFDPAMAPHHEVVQSCTFAGGYGGIPILGSTTPEYECAYNSLHLTDRTAQIEPVLGPAVLGYATWKEALWSIDFIGRLHDAASNPVDAVADADRALVGVGNNLVLGTSPAGASRGTYIGSTPLEGTWGLFMIAEMENAAAWLLSSLSTSDGTTLGAPFTLADATAYDYASPLRWFPTAIRVTENGDAPFPAPTTLAIDDATSHAEDLAALLVGNAMFFGMTDARNAGIGQRLGLELTFDGDPFAADDGTANGEATAHDRSLALLRVAFVDLDRMHSDPTLGVAVDTATANGGTIVRGNAVTTTSVAHVVVGLRQLLLSLNGAITQYGAADPSPAADANGILNGAPIHPSGAGADAGTPTFSGRVRDVFLANARFVYDTLTKNDGSVANGATIAGGAATASADPTTLEAQSAALRALVEAFLVTGDAKYATRARSVAAVLDGAFWSPTARMYRGTAGGADDVHMTPARFAWLQSALRETYKSLLGPDMGDVLGVTRGTLEDRIARVNKLYLNGWDDLDGNQAVDTTSECLAGRLQLGEQPLTGELGRDELGRATSDRDQDCVLEIDNAMTGSVMASDVHFHAP